MKNIFLNFQQSFAQILTQFDSSAKCQEDQWDRPLGGGGITIAIENGEHIEKAGVNFSHVFGDKLPPSASAHRPELANRPWQAMGVSTIVHPRNPFVPTTHANIRIFETTNSTGQKVYWVGGGFDLTPYYGFTQDCIDWHLAAKAACDPFGAELYTKFKEWADTYFYLPHRNEPRGIGGIFFDDFTLKSLDECLAFLSATANEFQRAYCAILERRYKLPYTEENREWQLYRRGRYVEFNLLYDRGTLFGLQSNGRTESILISLPSVVHFKYNFQPNVGSLEENLMQEFLVPKSWIGM